MARRGLFVAVAAGALGAALVAGPHCSRTELGGPTAPPALHGIALPMYHFDRARSGWSDAETVLGPAVVGRGLQRAWVTDPLDPATVTCPGDPGPTSYAPRLFATPLYLDDVAVSGG